MHKHEFHVVEVFPSLNIARVEVHFLLGIPMVDRPHRIAVWRVGKPRDDKQAARGPVAALEPRLSLLTSEELMKLPAVFDHFRQIRRPIAVLRSPPFGRRPAGAQEGLLAGKGFINDRVLRGSTIVGCQEQGFHKVVDAAAQTHRYRLT